MIRVQKTNPMTMFYYSSYPYTVNPLYNLPRNFTQLKCVLSSQLSICCLAFLRITSNLPLNKVVFVILDIHILYGVSRIFIGTLKFTLDLHLTKVCFFISVIHMLFGLRNICHPAASDPKPSSSLLRPLTHHCHLQIRRLTKFA